MIKTQLSPEARDMYLRASNPIQLFCRVDRPHLDMRSVYRDVELFRREGVWRYREQRENADDLLLNILVELSEHYGWPVATQLPALTIVQRQDPEVNLAYASAVVGPFDLEIKLRPYTDTEFLEDDLPKHLLERKLREIGRKHREIGVALRGAALDQLGPHVELIEYVLKEESYKQAGPMGIGDQVVIARATVAAHAAVPVVHVWDNPTQRFVVAKPL